MLKTTLTKKKSLLIAGGIAGVLVLGGGGVALASGLDDDRLTTQISDQASEAALAETGGGTVTEVDTLDDGLVGYEVEVVLPDGREAKVLLDGDYVVTSSRVDDDSDDRGRGDDDSLGSDVTSAPTPVDDAGGTATVVPAPVDDSGATPTPVPADDSGHHSGSRVDDDHGDDDRR